jgi:DNA-binding transcriptional LysR family regulator
LKSILGITGIHLSFLLVTLDDLRSFVAVCGAGSLSAVARDSGVSQSAISQHIRRLERELGVPLLERGRRGVLPTSAGKVLLAAAEDGLRSIDRARRELKKLKTGELGSLRVTTGGTTLRHFMIRPLAAFRRKYPAITFDYVSGVSTSQCLDEVRADRADLAYVTIGGDDTLEVIPTVRTEWVLVVAADHPLVSQPAVALHDLAGIRAIAFASAARSRSQMEQQLAGHGVQLQYAATVDDWDTAVQLVELGVGQAIVPALWIHDLDKRRRLHALPIQELTPVTFGWAARSWDALPDFAKTFTLMVNGGIASLGPSARIELVT